MNLRTLIILIAVAMALTFVAPVNAAPLAQTIVDEVVVTSTTTFTLTVRIDEVTTLAIPMQIDWRAEGPNPENQDEVIVAISPTVLRTGFFSVTVGSVEPMTGTLAVTLTQPAAEVAPITDTATTTATGITTATETTTATGTTTSTTGTGPVANAPTTNALANLRAGPGTNFAVVGSAQAGDALDIVGQNGDGTWFVLANGAWIAAFLVNNAPTGLPVVEPAATPAPTPTASGVLTPTAIPTVTPTP